MTRPRPQRIYSWPARVARFWVWPALVLAAVSARGQDLDGEPRLLRLNIPQMILGAEAEGLRESVTIKGSSPLTHDYLSVTPLLGLRMQGSVYHPNLMTFDVSGEGGYGWDTDTVSGPGSNLTRHEDQQLLRYLAQVNFLSGKPYNASFFAAQDHTYNNYDFFSTATVDTFRYGGRMAWTTKDFTLSSDMGYRDEKASGLNGTSDIADTYLNFSAVNQRERGSTSLTYAYDEYSNQVDASPTSTSVNHSISLSDSETFGSRKEIVVSTGLNYSLYQYFDQQTETLNATENITIHHTPTLDSFYSANYNHSSQAANSSELFQGIAGLRHRLYESLVSAFDVHGNYDDSSGSGNSARDDRYGVGLREDYTKRLGSWGRLSLGGSIIADHEDHDTSTGPVASVIDESHQLMLPTDPAFRPAYLTNPRVVASSITVRTSGGLPLQPNIDYTVIPSGQLTEIRLIQGNPDLPAGGAVLVTYDYELPPTSSFESLNAGAQIRLDLFHTVGIYGRLNWLGNNAPPQALAEDLTDLVGGVDVTWRFARAGAEYEDYDSTFTQYRDWRFFQGLTFPLSEQSTLSFDFSQIFYHYSDGRDDNQYQFRSRLSTQLTTWLQWNIEGGYFIQDAYGTTMDLAAARTDLSANWGKLSARIGYQYNYQLTQQTIATEERDRNFFYAQLRRTF